MGKYYYLIAGLPEISLDDSKLPLTVADFHKETDLTLNGKDKKLIELFYLKYDNKNLINQLEYPDREFISNGCISQEELGELITRMKEEGIPTDNKRIPSYFVQFIEKYLEVTERNEDFEISWEDLLSSYYYAYGMKCKNLFIASWFELNLNINNMLVAISARKYDLDRTSYIVGENEVATNLRISNARDFGIGVFVDYWNEIQNIAEESDLYVREKRIDSFKWEWLSEHSFFHPFEIEGVFAYLAKLEMLERWITLDKVTGEKTFRELIGAMKKGSEKALDEFKKNNTK
ncbi:MAG: DUF2764 domain-containing protein [Tannerella sp.]|jgi:hypothetical protein|nr:DUF2764 domain-containing protein [Tannerella sp.]